MNNKQLADKLEQWADALAESGGQKWVLSVPVREDVDPDCLMIEAAKRLRLAPLAEPVEGMRWVKASEQLPSIFDSHERHYRVDGKKVDGGHFYKSPNGDFVFEYRHHSGFITDADLSSVEWLDESSTRSAREELERFRNDTKQLIEIIERFKYGESSSIFDVVSSFKQQHNL